MAVKFYVGVVEASAIDAEFDSVSTMAEWIEEEMPEKYGYKVFLPHFISIVECNRCIAIIDMHSVPYHSSRDNIFKILCRGLIEEINNNIYLQDIEIRF